MSETSSSEVFNLELPVSAEATTQGAFDNAWDVMGRVYKLAQDKLNEALSTKLPPREDVLKAASEAYDRYVEMIEEAAKGVFIESVGRLYDRVAGVLKS